MITITAPYNIYRDKSDIKAVFLAGGISGCPDWQKELIQMCKHIDDNLILLNPRRKNFPIHDPLVAEDQIKWEHRHLREADAISFWFCKETLCPIVLYELGSWSMTNKSIFVGIDPEYQRRQDVEIQTRLVRPEVKMCYELEDLALKIETWYIEG